VLTAYRGWRERTKENIRYNCHACGALKRHPGIDCARIARRLRWSAEHQYDRQHPWDWPPEEIYSLRWGQWEFDREA
jgi:hypothetical protein